MSTFQWVICMTSEPSQDHLSGPHHSNKTLDKPSLSSDVKSMQADEVWKELDFLREQGAKTDLMLIGLKARSERLEKALFVAGELSARLEGLWEEMSTRLSHLAAQNDMLEERVAALEQASKMHGLAICDCEQEMEERMPLPREELD